MYFEYWYDFWNPDLQETRTVGWVEGGVLRISDNHFFATNGRALVELSGSFGSGYMY